MRDLKITTTDVLKVIGAIAISAMFILPIIGMMNGSLEKDAAFIIMIIGFLPLLVYLVALAEAD